MNDLGDSGDALDISGSSQFDETPDKHELLRGLHTPINGSDGDDTDISFVTRFQERYEDTRDALMESEPFAKVFDTTSKLVNSGTLMWAFSKKAAWVIGTSALVLVVPLLYEMDKEMNAGAAAESSQVGEPGGGNPASESS